MRDPDEIQIRSFRVVFELDRRLHRIDRWRLPLPYGLPLRSLGYGAAALATVVVAGRLPVVGVILGAPPAPVRFALIPCAAAYALTSVEIDGRAAHEAFVALMSWRLGSRVVSRCRRGVTPGQHVRFADVTISPDAAGPELRRGTVTGPAVAVVRYPTTARERGRTLRLEQASEAPLDDGFEVEFDAARRLVIR